MDDAFDTVAITYSQPEAAVMLSFLRAHGIAAYTLSEHARTQATMVVALGGIPVRVHRSALAEARALLAEVAATPAVVRPRLIRNGWVNAAALLLALALGGAVPPPRVRSELF